MEEWKIVFAVIGMIVYFLLNAKKATKKIKQDREVKSQETPQNPPVTFEEMMKQIMEGKSEKKREEARQEIPVETKRLEPKQHVPVQEKIRKKPEIPERKSREYFTYENAADRKIAKEHAARMAEKAISPDAYQKNKVKTESEYARLFETPEDARRAFVLGEIFNRKYS